MMSGVLKFLDDANNVAAVQNFFGLTRKNERQNHKNSSSHQNKGSGTSSESDVEIQDFEVRNRFWYWLFTFGSGLGDEIFYASVFPFWFWNIDGAVGRRIAVIWALSMYIGQCLKDIICWPRPPCPPVIRAQEKWAMEYGMPSTHALVSITVPFSILLLTGNRYEYNTFVGLVFAISWCILVSVSRLYFGMHSLGDILAGLTLASVLLAIFLPMSNAIDSFLLTHPASPGLLVTTAVTLMLIYPGSKFASAKEDTAVILGSSSGLLLGAWISYQMGTIRGPSIKPPYSVLWPSYEMLGLSLLRTIIGLITVLATRAIAKTASYALMRGLVQLRQPTRNDEDAVRNADVFIKIGAKLITYTAIGVDILWFAPAVFRLLNIERPTFHTEI